MKPCVALRKRCLPPKSKMRGAVKSSPRLTWTRSAQFPTSRCRRTYSTWSLCPPPPQARGQCWGGGALSAARGGANVRAGGPPCPCPSEASARRKNSPPKLKTLPPPPRYAHPGKGTGTEKKENRGPPSVAHNSLLPNQSGRWLLHTLTWRLVGEELGLRSWSSGLGPPRAPRPDVNPALQPAGSPPEFPAGTALRFCPRAVAMLCP